MTTKKKIVDFSKIEVGTPLYNTKSRELLVVTEVKRNKYQSRNNIVDTEGNLQLDAFKTFPISRWDGKTPSGIYVQVGYGYCEPIPVLKPTAKAKEIRVLNGQKIT